MINFTCSGCRFAICFPPCGVCLRTGCSCDLVINILLTLLGFFPGVLHALYVIGAWSGRDSSRCSHDGEWHLMRFDVCIASGGYPCFVGGL